MDKKGAVDIKKVIKGVLYNTESAKMLGRRESMRGSRCLFETLYKTKSGHYFLYGEILPMSAYASRQKDNLLSDSKFIIPLTPALAVQWGRKNLTAPECNKQFDEPEDSGCKEKLSLSVSSAVKRKLEKQRKETGKSISRIISELVSVP